MALEFFRLCAIAPLSPSARRLVEDPDSFPYSTVFERLVVPVQTRNKLGLEFTPTGLKCPPPEAILPVLAKILSDAADETIDTRKLHDESQQIGYLNRLKLPPLRAEKSVADIIASSPQAQLPVPTPSRKAAPPGRSTPKSAKASSKLLPANFVCEVAQEKLLEIIEEAKDLDINTKPFACAVVLRCLLEGAIQAAIRARKLRQTVSNHFHKSPDFVSIGELLKQMDKGGVLDFGLDSEARRGLKHLYTNGPLSVDVLHLYVHNPHWPVTPQSVRQLREAVLPVLSAALAK